MSSWCSLAALLLATFPPPANGSRAGTNRAGPAPGYSREAAVQRALEVATAQVGRKEIVVDGIRYGDDCTALVRAAFALAGRPLPPGADARALLALTGSRRRWGPAPGDLVFLSDRPGGPAEHVGIVSSVNADGTALVLHHTERGVARIRLNGAHPWKTRSESGRSLNDVLVVGAGKLPAGRLLVAYASLL